MQNRWKQLSRPTLLLATLVVAAGLVGPSAFTQGPVLVSGTIGSDTTWTASNTYVLVGPVFVENSTLTIEAGTRIIGATGTRAALVIARTGRLVADGRADAPIVMTSDQAPGSRDRANWGGLIINGNAPLNTGAEAFGEGDTGVYGGSNPDDSSGVLRYVRVEYAGIEFSPDNELNGIAFQGVGRNTVAEFVQVHFNKDDGIEFFGGTVSLKYAVVTGAADDSYDWTDGWQGKGQFWIAQQHGDDADQGWECDNNAENNDATPRSNPTIYNFTLIGDPDFDAGDESDIGILFREGTAARARNGIVMGFKEGGIDLDSPATFTVAQDGGLSIGSMIFFRNGEQSGTNISADSDDEGSFTTASWVNGSANIAQGNPGIRDAFDLVSPDFRPAPDAMATSGELAFELPPNDGFFEPARFIGAMGQSPTPDPDSPFLGNWVAGWTNFEAR